MIDLYNTQSREQIIIEKETAAKTITTDGLNPEIITTKDAQGNLYALNPDYGWFKVPQEIHMDYNKYQEYTELPYRYFGDGTANIIISLKYAENPTISPEAITPQYWVNFTWAKNVLYISRLPSADIGGAWEIWGVASRPLQSL